MRPESSRSNLVENQQTAVYLLVACFQPPHFFDDKLSLVIDRVADELV